MRNGGSMPLEVAQNAIVALRKAEPSQQSLRRTSSRGMGDKADQLRHPTSLSRVHRRG